MNKLLLVLIMTAFMGTSIVHADNETPVTKKTKVGLVVDTVVGNKTKRQKAKKELQKRKGNCPGGVCRVER